MSDVDIHFSNAKKQKKTRGRLVAFVTLGVLSVIAVSGGVYSAYKYRIFTLQNIEIAGNKQTEGKDIQDLLKEKIHAGNFMQRMLGEQNILAWPSSLAPEDIIKLPAIISLSMSKEYSARKIAITAVERSPYAIWCMHENAPANTTATEQEGSENVEKNEPSCVWFDKNGVAFMTSLHVEGMLIKKVDDYSGRSLPLSAKILPASQLPHLFEIFSLLDSANLPIKEIRMDNQDDQEISAQLQKGPRLLFSLRFSPDNVIPTLKDLSTRSDFSKISYIDFRVENRAYYK